MTPLTFNPSLFRITTKSSSNTFTWDLLTLEGDSPRETVYFMNKEDAPSSSSADQINEAIESENWEKISCKNNIILDYSIDLSIFETTGGAYDNIVSEIKEIILQNEIEK